MEGNGGLCAAISFGEPEMTRNFEMGRLVSTPAANAFCEENDINLISLVHRHLRGDWGDLCEDDKRANEQALIDGSRLLSSYEFPEGKVWVITEADRSSTCVLLPSDY
jgi:hypothetical protein